MKGKKTISLLIASVLLLSILTTVIGVSGAIEDEGWDVTIEQGTTEMFGGGDYTDFIFEDDDGREDARFGLIWGTEENPNSIIMTTNQKRYLGRISMKGGVETGSGSHEIDEEHFLEIDSIFGAKIGNIYEYETPEDDSVAPFNVDQNGEVESSYGVFKYVDLGEVAWDASDIEEIDEEGPTTRWEMSLTAEDLPYQPLPEQELDPEFEDETLDRIEFTFHLSATIEEHEDVEIPSFSAELEKERSHHHGPEDMYGGDGLRDMDRKRKRNCSAVVGSYEIKWDNEINGWNFDPENENPSLLLGFKNFFGNRIRHMERWHEEFMHQSGEKVRMETEDRRHGEFRAEFTYEQTFERNRLKRNWIEYGGDWSRAGVFSWVSNVTVDGEEKEATAQLFGGAPWMYPSGFDIEDPGRPDFEVPEYTGFMTWGGLNYPGGEDIFHDPAVSGDVFLDLTLEEQDSFFERLRGDLNVVLSFVLVAAAIIVVVGLLKSKRDRASKKENERNKDEPGREDWSKYYDRGE